MSPRRNSASPHLVAFVGISFVLAGIYAYRTLNKNNDYYRVMFNNGELLVQHKSMFDELKRLNVPKNKIDDLLSQFVLNDMRFIIYGFEIKYNNNSYKECHIVYDRYESELPSIRFYGIPQGSTHVPGTLQVIGSCNSNNFASISLSDNEAHLMLREYNDWITFKHPTLVRVQAAIVAKIEEIGEGISNK